MHVNNLAFFFNRIEQAKSEQLPIVNVDGSYLYKKHHELSHSGVSVPHLDPPSSPPITGWETATEKNVSSIATRLPVVTSGMCDLLFFI